MIIRVILDTAVNDASTLDVKTSKYSQFHVTRSAGGAFAPRRSIFIIVIIIKGFRFSAAEACDAVMLYENQVGTV